MSESSISDSSLSCPLHATASRHRSQMSTMSQFSMSSLLSSNYDYDDIDCSQPANKWEPCVSDTIMSSCEGFEVTEESEDDFPHRQEIRLTIINLLKDRVGGNASPEWMAKVPVMVEMLEQLLYDSASSLEQYRDQSTLQDRLQKLSVQMLQAHGNDSSMMDLEEQLSFLSF